MRKEPFPKRVVAFVDGQNLFHGAERCFGYDRPNFDISALVGGVCALRPDWQPIQTRFYTGIHSAERSQKWHKFWTEKTAAMGRQGVHVYTRTLRYHDGRAQEKGIDVRIALDVIGLALERKYDVALLFSQDQDLSEVATELRLISAEQGRWLRIASAFPCKKPGVGGGIFGTEHIEIVRALYDQCLDVRNYFDDPL